LDAVISVLKFSVGGWPKDSALPYSFCANMRVLQFRQERAKAVKWVRANLANRPIAVKWLIAFCLLLVLLSTAVQALHIDSRATEDLKDCPFCQVATATVIAILVVLLYTVYRTAVFITLSEDTEAIASFDVFTLFSRPPPLA
jgi:hypothetical protein